MPLMFSYIELLPKVALKVYSYYDAFSLQCNVHVFKIYLVGRRKDN